MSENAAMNEFLALQRRYDGRRRHNLHRLLRFLAHTLFDLKFYGQEHLPPSGGVILMMNHLNILDPALAIAGVRGRFVVPMAKEEARADAFQGRIVRWWGAYTVQRGEVDRSALNKTIALLQAGRIVLIAPEGTRQHDGLGEPHDGIAFVAAHANPIIVPCAVLGATGWTSHYKHLRRPHAEVHYGRPFRFNLPPSQRLTKALRATMMDEAMYQLALTIPPKYATLRGQYSDVARASTTTIAFV